MLPQQRGVDGPSTCQKGKEERALGPGNQVKIYEEIGKSKSY
jgi:hypothetical protein